MANRPAIAAGRDGGGKRLAMPHGEVLLSMIGLLCLGKSDYAAIKPFRRESFFARSLGLGRLPSAETLRRRMDQSGTAPLTILHEETVPIDQSSLAWDAAAIIGGETYVQKVSPFVPHPGSPPE